ncbi:hypothetical protein SLNSH_22355 [Alsobacter soli]|uniref:Uncharacterized protein n=1 Tax=Alsobacter soli TaxID=2109933 RepID=A0A2T1HMB3_9HYPH|nr:hypothetical protein [Alsobacter soli]PSC02787.1 hypothetical protein SLNSH_22355 [Alsobacter soli]
MGELVRFPRQPAPVTIDELYAVDETLIAAAYGEAKAAAERYEQDRRRERQLVARVDALRRENARLRAELAKRR